MRRALRCVSLCLLGLAPQLSAQSRRPVVQERVALVPDAAVSFHTIVVPDTVYVGEQATYEMGVFISESAQSRMRRNPEVLPSELRGLLAYDLGGPQSLAPLTVGNDRVFPHVLQRALFPLADGVLTLDAPRLSYTLPRSTSYFSREESNVIRAQPLRLVVRALPDAGRPNDFRGAVGTLRVVAEVDHDSARVGEPVVYTVRVTGRGNVKLLPRPDLQIPWASVVESGERVAVDTSGQYVRGSKEFDWLVTPERDGRWEIPVVPYPHFDPELEEYVISSTDSVALLVRPGQLAAPVDEINDDDGRDPIRRVDRGSLPAPLVERPLAWALMALVPVPALWWRRRHRRHAEHAPVGGAGVRGAVRARSAALAAQGGTRGTTTPGGASARAGGAHNVSPNATATTRRVEAGQQRHLLLAGLATRLGLASSELVERRSLERALRRRGVTRECTQRALLLIDELDAFAFGDPAQVDSGAGRVRDISNAPNISNAPTEAPSATWSDRATQVLAQVDAEAMRGGPSARWSATGRSVVFALLAGSGALGAFTQVARVAEARRASFAEAVAAYDAGAFADATAQFMAVAKERPRAADALANAGTAAWAAGDTLNAVRGWQRALRLEPLAADVRVSLLALPGARDGVASVPGYPADLFAWLTFAAWIFGWVVVAWRVQRVASNAAGAPPAWIGSLLLVAAVTLGVVHAAHRHRLAAPDLAIVSRSEPMRRAPGADADALGGVTVGDVVRSEERRADSTRPDDWVRVEHADGRGGWLPASALVPLAARAPAVLLPTGGA